MPNCDWLSRAFVASSVALSVLAGAPSDTTSVAEAKVGRPPTSTPTSRSTPSPTPTAGGGFVKVYANIANGIQADVTPEDVQVTSDGGSIVLALTQAQQSSNGVGVSWLVRLDASGNPQWQEELGCFGTAPGDYTDGVSVQQTTDGGYVVGGGTIGCGSATICPPSSGIQCALVEKLDSSGRVSWAHVYGAGAAGSAITQIKQTTSGDYIAVGSVTDAAQNTGALILKLDSLGDVQWQRRLGPDGSTQAYFNATQQTSDGGYVAVGESYVPLPGVPHTSVLVIKFDSSGTVQWQQGFNNFDGGGSPSSAEHVKSVIQTPSGDFVVGGNWSSSAQPGQCCAGGLLVKLQSDGSLQWQNAYSGGVSCFFNGYSETCTNIGTVIYSVHPTPDGGYDLVGSGNLELNDSVPLVPWAAKVDTSGNLVWQHFYYQTNPTTGRTLSEYFASSVLTSAGGALPVGWTENLANGLGQLFGVRTDAAGLVGTCKDVKSATPLQVVNPALTRVAPALPVETTITPIDNSTTTTLSTSITTKQDC
jgi:hypothetical protein